MSVKELLTAAAGSVIMSFLVVALFFLRGRLYKHASTKFYLFCVAIVSFEVFLFFLVVDLAMNKGWSFCLLLGGILLSVVILTICAGTIIFYRLDKHSKDGFF